MQEVGKLFSLCVLISTVVFAHKRVYNLCDCVGNFHFEMNPVNNILPVLRVKNNISSSDLFLMSKKMHYQSEQNCFVVQHLKTDLTTQIANRQKIQQKVLECSSIFLVLASRYFRNFFSIRFQLVLVLENGDISNVFSSQQLYNFTASLFSIQGFFNNVFSLLTVKI